MFLVVALPGPGNNRPMQYLLAAIIGLVGGVSSGLFGIGGGIVMVPAMVYFLNTNITTAIGTSLIVIIPTAITGSIKHYHLGNVDWRVALALIPMAMIGGYFGAKLTQVLPAVTLKKLFGGVMIIAGLQLIFRK